VVSIVGAGGIAALLLAVSPLAPTSRAALLPAGGGAVILAGVLLGRRLVRRRQSDLPWAALVNSLLGMPLLTAILLSVLAFGMLAAIAGVCGGIVFGEDARTARIAGAYLIAWLSGFVVPGAAGGVGIREAVLVAQLGPDFGEAAALAFALLMRLQSVFGDILLLCVSLAMRQGLRDANKVDEAEASSRSS
jgi:hypothetical protein